MRRLRGSRARLLLAFVASLTLAFAWSLPVRAVDLVQVSTDPYTDPPGQHQTEVEPDTLAFGSTIVSAFQVGRVFDGGATNIGWATSTDAGATWAHGPLPGITVAEGGIYPRVSDPAVAYDAAHGVWLASSLALTENPVRGAAVVVSRSVDGLTWDNPVDVYVAVPGQNLDKNWTTCDDTPTSPFFGNCYTEFDDNGDGDRLKMTTSSDGGLTWSAPVEPLGRPTGLGGQPVVQPNGTVVVPASNAFETAIISFVSTDGGASWSSAVTISTVRRSTVHGNLRAGPLPSAGIDRDGSVYVVWQDCRFENPNCGGLIQAPHDIVLTTSSDGLTWSDLQRIPIDGVGSGFDHFIPGLGAAGNAPSVGLGLTYYFYPDSTCTPATCLLNAGFISSCDGGATWNPAQVLTVGRDMNTSWLANTSQGRMVGDYIATSFAGDGLAHTVIAVANAPGSQFDEAMYTTSGGLGGGCGRAGAGHAGQSAPRTTGTATAGTPQTSR